MRVAIIGAGISGLALAYYLQKLGVPYDLFEASENVGGNIKTVKESGYLLELGPNSLQVTPELKTLLQELKLEREVVPAAQAGYQRYVLHNGSYEKLPANPFSLLSNTFFSWKTKLRILREKEIPPADIDYETIAQFFERRFGHGVINYAVNPFIAGIYGGDPEKLLVRKALPALKELENNYGSVLKGLMQQKSDQLTHQNISFANGMQTLPNAIAEKLISLHTGHRVEMITRNQGKYIISCATTGDYDTQEYNLLVLALPALQAAELLHYTFPGMAAALQNIHYPPMAVVHSVYNRNDVSHELDGYGALHPKAECPFAVSSVWSSSLFEGRCRPHEVLFTSFVGGAQFEQHALTHKDELMACVHKELEVTYGIKADKPVFQHMYLWEHSIPQYDLYIEDAHHMAERLEQEGLFIAANWQAGVSVVGCIRHAKELAHKINLKRPAPSIAE
ncbi:protoporphyrinogen oxidase [Pontibacter pudoricolor]|uniref:protoporphyrinogen oxidase n=1 Tax=Pontibacter pudoricolor TaxID=2694930 RepID=UPI00139097DC|nr:protoporphyrinogen oxidase [Pontibacter pudoricolor]